MNLSNSKLVLLIGVFVVVLAAFGVDLTDKADEFQIGVGICFASFLVP